MVVKKKEKKRKEWWLAKKDMGFKIEKKVNKRKNTVLSLETKKRKKNERKIEKTNINSLWTV